MSVKHIFTSFSIIFICTLINSSCKKFVTVPPPVNQLISGTVFEDERTADASLAGLYYLLSFGGGFAGGGSNSITYSLNFSADEAIYPSLGENYRQINDNALLATNGVVANIWSDCYSRIYGANSIIEGVANADNLSTALRTELEAEAKFIRAFCHFYLVNLYGDIPYITTTDYRQNTIASRTSKQEVYQHIIADLQDAKQKLVADYSYSKNERVRPNKWAAAALLARVYLYSGNWQQAETEATEVINETGLYGLEPLTGVFLKNSREAIWQLIPGTTGNRYTSEGNIFILVSSTGSAYLREEFVNNSFEPGDMRKGNWTGSITITSGTYNYAYKYKQRFSNGTGAEYSMVLRLAEQYLVRAEARAMQNKLTGANSAESDINLVRSRAALGPVAVSTQPELLSAIEQERKVELFSEWGHRWFDLKRTGRAGAVLAPLKSGWSSSDTLFPIPYAEILVNQKLTQNPGY